MKHESPSNQPGAGAYHISDDPNAKQTPFHSSGAATAASANKPTSSTAPTSSQIPGRDQRQAEKLGRDVDLNLAAAAATGALYSNTQKSDTKAHKGSTEGYGSNTTSGSHPVQVPGSAVQQPHNSHSNTGSTQVHKQEPAAVSMGATGAGLAPPYEGTTSATQGLARSDPMAADKRTLEKEHVTGVNAAGVKEPSNTVEPRYGFGKEYSGTVPGAFPSKNTPETNYQTQSMNANPGNTSMPGSQPENSAYGQSANYSTLDPSKQQPGSTNVGGPSAPHSDSHKGQIPVAHGEEYLSQKEKAMVSDHFNKANEALKPGDPRVAGVAVYPLTEQQLSDATPRNIQTVVSPDLQSSQQKTAEKHKPTHRV